MDSSTEQVPSIRTASQWNGTLSSSGLMQRISPGTRCWVNIFFSMKHQRCLFSNNLLSSYFNLPSPPQTTFTDPATWTFFFKTDIESWIRENSHCDSINFNKGPKEELHLTMKFIDRELYSLITVEIKYSKEFCFKHKIFRPKWRAL